MVNGQEFRKNLRRPMPLAGGKKGKKGAAANARVVPAFTIQSMQRGTVVAPPPRVQAFKYTAPGPSAFRAYYTMGDFPVSMEYEAGGAKITWKVDLDKLDYSHYLPIFFDGLRETEHPLKLFAAKAIHDMLDAGGQRVFPCIPQLIIPLKNALNTRDPDLMRNALKVMQHMVTAGDKIGEALVPYYRQLLPVLNLYKDKNVNCGDNIDTTQQKDENLCDTLNQTLELLEQYGGEDAYINIKYIIPTYESCMMN